MAPDGLYWLSTPGCSGTRGGQLEHEPWVLLWEEGGTGEVVGVCACHGLTKHRPQESALLPLPCSAVNSYWVTSPTTTAKIRLLQPRSADRLVGDEKGLTL